MTDGIAGLRTSLADRYEIDREIGAGGMATVYLARDLKHNRKVALKVLRPDLGAVLGVERFLSEIQVTANLQHPNLLPLFDSGEAGGQLFYVMPFIDGESLRARLDREKQLPVDEAVRIAVAIASALDYAHRHGVIHRDLKPENILLHEGQPLVADFGIALAVSNAGGNRITQTGLSLGTPHYMSPEQATGDRTVDARTDIYSLGALAYEMLTGDPPHTGSTSQAIIARMLTEKPRSIRATRANVPEHVEGAVDCALEKLPADRFASAKEFADALSGKVVVTRAATAAHDVAAVRSASRGKTRAVLIALGVVAWGASVFAAFQLARPDTKADVVKFEIQTPLARDYATVAPSRFRISPDGRYVVYAGAPTSGVAAALWLRPMDSTGARELPGTVGAAQPFWSADSRSVGFVADEMLKRVDLEGGAPLDLIEARQFGGGAWNADGVIVFSSGGNLYRIDARGRGRERERLPGDSLLQPSGRLPEFLPDGRHILYLDLSAALPPDERGIRVRAIDAPGSTRIADVESQPVYAEPGFLIYHRQGTVFAQPFDAKRRRTYGEPVRLADNVSFQSVGRLGAFDASRTGVLGYRTGAAVTTRSALQWYGRDGASLGRAGEPGLNRVIRLANDDKRVAMLRYDVQGVNTDAWMLDVSTNIESRVTTDPSFVGDVVWTHDARAIAYISARPPGRGFYLKQIGGAGDSLLYRVDGAQFPDDFSTDGRYLLMHGTRSLGVIALTDSATRTLRQLRTTTTGAVDEPRFSPDGKWIAFGSSESGAWEVYVARFPEVDNVQKISARGGVQVRWRGDGKELYYLAPDGTVMSVAMRVTGTAAEFSAPAPMFKSPLSAAAANISQWDVTRDGRRFLFLVPERDGGPPPSAITIVLGGLPALK